jgi:hypothetical protein
MNIIRRVAIVHGQDSSSIVLELCKPLNAESFDGILEWSHCWLVIFRHDISDFDLVLFEIKGVFGRKLELSKLDSKKPNLTDEDIVADIKPVHPLDVSYLV